MSAHEHLIGRTQTNQKKVHKELKFVVFNAPMNLPRDSYKKEKSSDTVSNERETVDYGGRKILQDELDA